ncbi:MAG: aminotransferase class V-fold PLP-dependent enzyme [Chloroflexota bacterium]
MRAQFLLDPAVIYLNHGSFGACPRPVFEVYQRWQLELERQPVAFLGRRANELLAGARAALAIYLGIQADDVVYFPNPTTALNVVIRSLDLRPGDEILTTDHEYGALDRTWRFVCRKTGARYVQRAVPLPVTDHADFVEHFWAGVTGRTRLIFISHITSPTALIFPVQELCRRARQAGLLSIVDGAHAPGHVPLNLSQLGADIYAGACHKWLCAPKGAAFLYVRREVQSLLEPLVVSWGWESERPGASQFIDHHEWQGTRDLAAFLTAPAAIDFQAQHDWPAVRRRCQALVLETRRRLNALTGLEPICPDSEWLGQMFAARLPDVDLEQLKARLYDAFHIEAPLLRWQGQPLIRVSFQAYNSQADADALLAALGRLLPEFQR